MGQERLGPSYVFISIVLGPLNSLLSYVPSSGYIWSSDPILFRQEQTKTSSPQGISLLSAGLTAGVEEVAAISNSVCFITAGPITKLCAWGEEESGGHVL